MASTTLHTPVPIGGSHLVDLPTFDRWGIQRSGQSENRDYQRRPIQCDIWLIDSKNQVILRCRTQDVSDAGVRGSAPIGFGLAVGQRYESRMAHGGADPRSGPPTTLRSLGFGTVTRTDILVGGERPDRVTFALRFDVPQLMPLT